MMRSRQISRLWLCAAATLMAAGCSKADDKAAGSPAETPSALAGLATPGPSSEVAAASQQVVQTAQAANNASSASANEKSGVATSEKASAVAQQVAAFQAQEAAATGPFRAETVERVAAALPEVPLAAVAAAGVPEPFRFSDDASGKLQAERLAPSRIVPLEDVPRVTQPLGNPVSAADRLKVSSPTPIDIPAADPRALPSEQSRIGRYLPTYDRPPLPLFSVALVPQEPEFGVAQRTRIPAAIPEEVPNLAVTLAPFEIKPVFQDDPSAPSARRALLSPLAFADPVAAPPEKLSIPDPFEYLRPVQLRTPPVDSIAPSVSYERPAPIVLPVDK